MKKIILLLLLSTSISFYSPATLYAQVFGEDNVSREHARFRYDPGELTSVAENYPYGPYYDENYNLPAKDTLVDDNAIYTLFKAEKEDELPATPAPGSLTRPGTWVSTSPCSPQAIINSVTITNFFNTPCYQASFNDLIKTNAAGVGREFATVFGMNSITGLPMSLPMITTSAATSVTINVSSYNLSVKAICHTHPDNVFPAPSAGDLYAFGTYARSHPDFLYYVLASNGSKYVLMVSDQEALDVFLRSYPQQTNIEPDSMGVAGRGANYNNGSELYLTMQQVAYGILSKSVDPDNPTLTELDIAHEAVQVYILDHFKTGITLFKQDSNGNFNEMHTAVAAPNAMMKIEPCK